MNSETVTIANVGDQEFNVSRTYGSGNYRIPACPTHKEFVSVKIKDAVDRLDLGEGKFVTTPIRALDIARDIVGDFVHFGVFVCINERPTHEEICKAIKTMEEHATRQVEEADGIWEKTHDYKQITDVMRRSAKLLGLGREWISSVVPMQDCPFCGERVKPGVAVCKSCKGVLDADKALKGGIISAEQHAAIKGVSKTTPKVTVGA